MDRRRVKIGDTYHQWTKYRREEMSGGGLDWNRKPAPYKEYPPEWRRIPIPPAATRGGRPLWGVMTERRSIREFSEHALTMADLSQLLWATQGITMKAWGFEFRTAPSAGALYPIETYLVVNRVEGLSPGIYHYQVMTSELVLLKEGDFGRRLSHAALDQEMLREAACVFIWTAIVDRSKWKYRERAYRYLYMDAGHIGQNLHLAAAGLQLGCCMVGAFFDEEVDSLLEIDGAQEVSVYLGAVGKRNE